jgi:hypothetical protein
MVKLVYDREMKNPKGPCVILIHANWCGFCKELMPKFENEIVTSRDFSKELEGLLTLGSIEETEYNNHKRKKIFGKIDGYPIVRYIHFSHNGTPMRSFDLSANTPREPQDIIEWINGVVKNDIVKNGVVKNGVVKNGVVKNGVVKNGIVKNSKKRMNKGGSGKNKKYKTRTMRTKSKRNRHRNRTK